MPKFRNVTLGILSVLLLNSCENPDTALDEDTQAEQTSQLNSSSTTSTQTSSAAATSTSSTATAVLPTTPTVTAVTVTQNGITATWTPSSHSSGISKYELRLMSGSSTLATAESTSTSTSISQALDVGTYSVAVRAVSNDQVNGNYGINSATLQTADLVYNVTLTWRIRSLHADYYTTKTCTSTKQLLYGLTQQAVDVTYASCTFSISGYNVGLSCPIDSYTALGGLELRYRTPSYVNKASGTWFTQTCGGYSCATEVGTCGTWTFGN